MTANITPAYAVDSDATYSYNTQGTYTPAEAYPAEPGYKVQNNITTTPSSSVYNETENQKTIVTTGGNPISTSPVTSITTSPISRTWHRLLP